MRKKNRLLFEKGGKRKGYGWKKGTDEHVKKLGKFVERLTQHILGGVLQEDGDPDCDVWHGALDLGIEAKAGSNRDGVKVRENQLDARLTACESGFLYSNCCYAFLKYKNGNGGAERLFQESVHKDGDVSCFLAVHTTALHVVDVSVVDAVRKKQDGKQRVTMWRRNGATPAVQIGWRFFDQLHRAPKETLCLLGLNPRSYRLESRSIQTTFEGHTMEFSFAAILPARLMRKSAARTLFPIDREGGVRT